MTCHQTASSPAPGFRTAPRTGWRNWMVAASLIFAAGFPPAVRAQDMLNDYPTEARAEYVFACMAANGQTQEFLRRCSCSIDTIATILPYADYVSAETVMRMRFAGGEQGAMFRSAPSLRAILAELRRAQAEAEILCF